MAGAGLRVLHPTDFSQNGHSAFVHALKIAIATRGDLFLLHVKAQKHKETHWSEFPRVRETLVQWGLLESGASAKDVERQLGIQVGKFDLVDSDIVTGVAKFTEKYGGDVVVLSTEARHGLARLIESSTAEAIMHSTGLSSLFVPQQARGFVDPQTGEVSLHRILAPVDHEPNPLVAIRELVRIMGSFGLHRDLLDLIHIGDEAPDIKVSANSEPAAVTCLDGPVVDTILDKAKNASLVGLATEGHHGIMDALRGSTSEQIIRGAPCPVLAIPVRR